MADTLQPAGRVTVLPSDGNDVKLGDWYWINWETYDDDTYRTRSVKRELVCVVRIGTNYVKVKAPGGGGTRIHFNEFDKELTPEPDAKRIIAGQVAAGRDRVLALMDEVRGLAARLGVGLRHSLAEGDVGTAETQQLSLRKDGTAIETYKKDLVRAQEETLPGLFKKIEAANKSVAAWMKADLLPLEGMVKAIEPVVKAVKARIFAVELYAGLVERVACIREGEPADLAEPVHLFQRRHYMDEECLAAYKAGGMRFEKLPEFERWLLRKDNLARVLPLPRCVVAFRVRREAYEENAQDWHDFIRIALSDEQKYDKVTFLYMRNGGRVYRLRTGIEFDEKLFPDVAAAELGGTSRIYAYKFASSYERLLTGEQYDALLEQERQRNLEVRRQAVKDKRRRAAGDKDAPPPGPWHWESSDVARRHTLWTPDDVHYDDISEFVRRQVEQHNRVVIVLQGLLDRSEVFHPHPPWQLWTQEGFETGLRLHFDTDRALSDGPPPDFEAYRQRLNAVMKPGDYAAGQELQWELREAARNNARNRYSRNHYSQRRYRPHGDPGPGTVAQAVQVRKSGWMFRWTRVNSSRSWRSEGKAVKCCLVAPPSTLLNVSAYRPGDYLQFYADPRTRADYLKWAPLLLAAEDWHAAQADLRRTRAYHRDNSFGCVSAQASASASAAACVVPTSRRARLTVCPCHAPNSTVATASSAGLSAVSCVTDGPPQLFV